jgi:uncharacterized metal-binding protein
MPSGRTHNVINLTFLLPFAWAASSRHTPQELIVTGGVSYIFATYFLSPDLDLEYSGPSSRWRILRLFWKPYSWLFHHRGLSHSLLFGTLTRLTYLAALTTGLSGVYYFGMAYTSGMGLGRSVASAGTGLVATVSHVGLHLSEKRAMMFAVLAGILASDLVHILSDRLNSARKQLFRI